MWTYLGIVLLLGLPYHAVAQRASTVAADTVLTIGTVADSSTASPNVSDQSARVETAYLTLGRINATSRSLANTADITAQLPVVEANIQTIYNNLTQFGSVISARQLLTFRMLLKDMREDLTTWRTTLTASGQQLATMQTQLADLRQQLGPGSAADPAPGDTVLAQTLGSIRRKQARTSLLVQAQLQQLRKLQNRVSGSYIHLLELDDNLTGQFRQLGIGAQAQAGQLVRRLYTGQ